MTAAPNATRMTARTLADDKALLAREAQDIAEAATRIAQNVDRALACGDFAQLAAQVHAMTLRAERTTARQETANLFAAELAEATS